MRAFVGFAGFGGVDIALREFGFEVIGAEIDDAIAEVNRMNNGGHCLTADILDINPPDYIGYDLMHFSPPCPNFSVAKNIKIEQDLERKISDLARFQKLLNTESEIDLHLSRKICEFIRVVRPKWVTLENVWAYRKSLSFMNIWYTLLECSYGVNWWNLNAADYGTPQTRRRMIVIARRDGWQPAKPWPTHSKKPDMFTRPWRGWYEAIEDLIPGLPESEFAPWQIDRMPEKLKPFLAPGNGKGSIGFGIDKPPPTIAANSNQDGIKAFFLESQNGSHSVLTTRDQGEPSNTIMASFSRRPASMPKAFIIGGQYQTPNNGSARIVQNKHGDSPDWTITASENGDTRACLRYGRVVSITPRALARFQDFPDWFKLPENTQLACKGIGNAVPVGVYRAVLRSLELEK